MKILALGDIQGDSSISEKLAARAEKEDVDLVIICGDLTEGDQSTKNIIGPFVKRNKKVIMVPGNHESIATVDFLAEVYGAVNLHGYSIKHKDVGFFGCSGVNLGIHQLDEKEIYTLLKEGFEHVKDMKTKIMVTHVHPTETTMEKFTSFFKGSSGVRKAIEQFKPDILLCSHVHEAEGIEEKVGKTRVINVGRNGRILEF
jgi:uncharacterized protein